MFCRSKLLICFHAVAFFSIRVISAMYTNHIDARSINVNSDIGKKSFGAKKLPCPFYRKQ